MAKIKLNKLPDGFEIKDGKVVKKMQQGGMMTGDQSNYGLVTSPYNFGNDQFNNSDDVSVRYSLSSVPREAANIEAEGGETVLTDLNDDGQFGLYNIKGPRHSKGGVPMYLPEQSFIFSDTPKMKFNRQEMADFGIESRKKITPAKISKKFQLNEYIGAMADPFADEITIRSAELMKDKNQMSLSKLAFGQEAKKQFSDGVPATAHPYLISQGINPIEFTQKVENITREQAAQRMFQGLPPEQQAQVMALRQMMEQAGQMQQPMAAYGMELPRAQEGNGEYQKMSNGKYGIPFIADAQEGVYYFNPANGTAYQFTNGKYVEIGKHAVDTEGNPVGSLIPTGNPHAGSQYNTTMENAGWVWSGDAQAYVQASGALDPSPPATTIPATASPASTPASTPAPAPAPASTPAPAAAPAASRRGGRTNLDVSEIQGGRGLGDNYSEYQELERLFTSGDDMWETTIDKAYVAFVTNAKAQGISESDIPSKDDMIQIFLDYQKNNYMIADLMPEDMRYAKELDRGRGDRKNKNTQALFNKAAELYPDLYGGYNIDDKTTQLNQLFFQAVTIADRDNSEPYLSYTATGPNQNTNWAVNKTISKKDGFYGNNTLNQFLQVAEPEVPDETEEGCLCPDGTYSLECCDEPGDIRKYRDPDLDFYTQDLYKGAAIALRDRNMYMPFRQELERPRADYVLEEPTRQLADINEKYNIASQAMGAFAGPQSLSARLSNASGTAMSNAANVFARVHGRNINTINSGLALQGQLDAAYNALSAQRNDQEYDATQATLQMYDNEKNADMNDFMNWQADALTNAVGAYNLSSLYDQFNINPVSGGTIDFVNGRRPMPAKQGDPRVAKQQRMQDLQDLYNTFGKDGVSKSMIDYYTSGAIQAENPMLSGNYAEQYGLTPEVLAAMSLANGQGKKGKEIKKFAVPFYTGKMGS